jgi:hypothetical protein
VELKTDMNDRERDRFAVMLRGMAEAANGAANALEKRYDQGFLVSFMVLTLSSGFMKEVHSILESSLKKMKDDPVEFPPIIGD